MLTESWILSDHHVRLCLGTMGTIRVSAGQNNDPDIIRDLIYITIHTIHYYTFNSVRKSKVVESMTSKELMVCNFINENFRNSPTERTVWEWPNSCDSIFDDNSYTIIHDRHHVMNISSHRPSQQEQLLQKNPNHVDAQMNFYFIIREIRMLCYLNSLFTKF